MWKHFSDMKKLLLIAFIFLMTQSQAQIFRLTYNTTICPSPLNGAPAIYLYAGANTISPGSAPTYFADASVVNLYPLTQTGTGIWEICFNPYLIFKDGNGSLIPNGATIYSIDVNFRNAASTIFTGNCQNASIRISDPLTNPVSSSPSIASGLVVASCNVGIGELSQNTTSITCSANPLRVSTTFKLNIPTRSSVSLDIYNVLGKKVHSVISEKQMLGYSEILWDGTDQKGNPLANGAYFYTFKVGDKMVNTNKLILSR